MVLFFCVVVHGFSKVFGPGEGLSKTRPHKTLAHHSMPGSKEELAMERSAHCCVGPSSVSEQTPNVGIRRSRTSGSCAHVSHAVGATSSWWSSAVQ